MSFNKQPAKWNKVLDMNDTISVHQSEGGAIKIVQDDKILVMFPVRQFETLHAVFLSLDPKFIEQTSKQATLNKEKSRIDKEMKKHEERAAASVTALADIAKAKGLDPAEYLAKVLTGKIA